MFPNPSPPSLKAWIQVKKHPFHRKGEGGEGLKHKLPCI